MMKWFLKTLFESTVMSVVSTAGSFAGLIIWGLSRNGVKKS